MKRFSLIVALMVVTGVASRASAEEAGGPNMLVAGAKSVSFALPTLGDNPYYNGAAGAWYMLDDHMNIGANVGLLVNPTGNGSTNWDWEVALAPAVRYYLSTSGVVSPFIHGSAVVRFYDLAAESKHVGLSGSGGVGAEWFPVRNFSVAGQTGLNIDIVRPDPGKPIKIATFTSGLSVQVYWE